MLDYLSLGCLDADRTRCFYSLCHSFSYIRRDWLIDPCLSFASASRVNLHGSLLWDQA